MKRTLGGILLSLALMVTVLQTSAPVNALSTVSIVAQQNCQSPLEPGEWSGEFIRRLKVENQQGAGVRVFTLIEGGLDITIGCAGDITGKFHRAPWDEVQANNVKVSFGASITALDEEATCDLPYDYQIAGAKVSAGEGGRPRVEWAIRPVQVSSNCKGSEALLPLVKGLTKDTGSTTRAFIWQATGDWSPTGAKGDQPWDDPLAVSSVDALQKVGTVTEEQNWALHKKGAPPTSTPKQEEAPVIVGLTSQFQGIFLENIPQVNNLYTANINWNGGQPGTVQFQMDTGIPVNGSMSGSTASATFPLHTLAAGIHTLSVRAISAKGKASPVKTLPVQVAKVPAWAKPFNLVANPNGNSILYKSTKPVLVPEQKAQASVHAIVTVPYLAGEWGFKDVQFETNLEASSLGTARDTEVASAGIGLHVVADTSIPYFVKPLPDSFLRARIDSVQNTLVIDDGRIKPASLTPSFIKNIPLDTAFPGLTAWLLKIQAQDAFVASFNVPPPSIEISVEGEGAHLGVAQDKVALTGGEIKSHVDVLPSGVTAVKGTSFVQLIGTLTGTVTFDVAPELAPQDCIMAGVMGVFYGTMSFSGFWPLLPDTILSTKCENFGISGAHRGSLLAAPLKVSDPSLKQLPRSEAWVPETVVEIPSTADQADSVKSATLIENAGALTAAPKIVAGPSGRLALTWVGEVADRPRPQAYQARLRIFDGKAWGPLVELSSDTRPDYNPSVAFDAKGQAVVAWTQSSKPDLPPDATLTEELLRSMEIGYAVVGPDGKLVKSGTLTNDSTFDSLPQLSASGDGMVWLMWQSIASGRLSGDANSPRVLQAVRWNGQEWSAPEQVYAGLTGPADWRLTSGSGEKALVIACNYEGEASNVVGLEHSAQGWGAPTTLATGIKGATTARAAYGQGDSPLVAWSTGQGLWGVMGDLKAAPSLWMTGELQLEDLLADAGGNVSLALADTTDKGSTNLVLASYNQASKAWGKPEPFIQGWKSTSALSLAPASKGEVKVVFAQPLSSSYKAAQSAVGSTLMAQVPELASIQLMTKKDNRSAALASVPSLVKANEQPADSTLWLMIGGAVALVLVAVVAFVLRRGR